MVVSNKQPSNVPGSEPEEEKAVVNEVLSLGANTEVGSVVDDIMVVCK